MASNKVVGTNMSPKGNFPSPAGLGWKASPGRQAKPDMNWGAINFPKKGVMNPKLKRSLQKKGLSRNYST